MDLVQSGPCESGDARTRTSSCASRPGWAGPGAFRASRCGAVTSQSASEDERALQLTELHEAALLTPKQHGVFVVFKVVGSSAAMPVLPSKRSGLGRPLGPTASDQSTRMPRCPNAQTANVFPGVTSLLQNPRKGDATSPTCHIDGERHPCVLQEHTTTNIESVVCLQSWVLGTF